MTVQQANKYIEPHILSVAPMMQWTHRHFRVLLRLLVPEALLYTEMCHARAVCHAPERVLGFDPCEQPLALQIAGSDADELRRATERANPYNFAEINLNLGCPSGKVQKSGFGASLLHHPAKAGTLMRAMRQASDVPVSAKIRIGVDDKQGIEYLTELAQILVNAGCSKLIVHARIALLGGLSTKENRTVLPIDYEMVYALKQAVDVPIVLNGEISAVEAIERHLKQIDGIMIGRSAVHDPYRFACVGAELFGRSALTRIEALARFLQYAQDAVAQGWMPRYVTTCLLQIYKGMPKARLFRQLLMQHGNDIVALRHALMQQQFLPS